LTGPIVGWRRDAWTGGAKTGQLLLASNNPGKVREFRVLLDGCGWEILAPADLGLALDVEETGTSYAANARLKAQAFAAASGCFVLADDSGLEVDALDGAPGVYSARYGGAGLSDADRVQQLLAALAAVPLAPRTARFRAVLVLRAPDGRSWQTEGVCEGEIAPLPRGDRGFGYDPIFLLPALGRTMAELSAAEKNQLSHRARAARAVLPILHSLAIAPVPSRERERDR
jgi:XTP/dITP diphosphohydrolase